MVSSSIITGSLDSSIMRMSGGFIVDELKYENVVYRQVLHSYLSILIENGVPLLLFRDFQPGIADVQFQKRIIDD
jgi:hypothetical protein